MQVSGGQAGVWDRKAETGEAAGEGAGGDTLESH